MRRAEGIKMYHTEHILEFDKIKKIWESFALTEHAKEQIQSTHPYLVEAELHARTRETTEGKLIMEKFGNPPLISLNGIAGLLATAEKGECLSGEQLEEIGAALVAFKRLKEYLNKGTVYKISLAFYEENIQPLTELKEMIALQIMSGAVADNASKRLRDLRGDIKRAEDKMREKAEAVIRANKECMSDSFSTFRNGHVCIPVKKEYKFRIGGTVIDKSSTGNTLFMEPSASAKYYEELQELRMDEENEVRRILYELTVLVDEHREVLLENIRVMEKLDFIFSKGKLSFEYDGREAVICTERYIRLKNARHPLMAKEVCVPLQFEIGSGLSRGTATAVREDSDKNVWGNAQKTGKWDIGENGQNGNESMGGRPKEPIRGIVITGPNTGGKTVAIKTVALNCMMAQCGLHVACEEAEICMNSNYLCDIGDGQNLSENLSTFSAHITNVLEILKKVNRESLVIMDELGSGTDPMEGMGIAIAILEELKKSGALFLVTTHYPEVKVFAEKEQAIVNARMTFDKENLKPLYQMVIGEAGESCAFYIAGRLGMPAKMLRRAAREAYGEVLPEELKRQLEGDYEVEGAGNKNEGRKTEYSSVIVRKKNTTSAKELSTLFSIGDSVMVLPDKKTGIVCEPVNEKGVLRVQLPGKKIYINYKRVKLLVAARELYPENYDFSIIFDTVENRKLRHQMERKHVEGQEIHHGEE